MRSWGTDAIRGMHFGLGLLGRASGWVWGVEFRRWCKAGLGLFFSRFGVSSFVDGTRRPGVVLHAVGMILSLP